MQLSLNNARLAFPAIFEAKSVANEEPAFSASLILTPDHPQIAAINEAIEAVAKEKWGAKASEILKGLRAKDNVCLHDGDEKSNYDGFEGNFYISARAKTRPLVIDRDKSPLVQSDGRPYGGCYVNGLIALFVPKNWAKVCASLEIIQKTKDGESFGAPRVDAEDVMPELPDEDDGEFE